MSTFVLTIISINDEGRVDQGYAFSDNNLFLEAENNLQNEPEGYIFTSNNTILAQSLSSPVVNTQVLGSNSGNSTKRDSIISHSVKSGESLDSIAEKFDISKDTIRWANSISGNNISVGDELLILPTTGVLYYVKRGDTLSHIAQRHEANGDEIIEFNNVKDETEIKPGDQLIIPDGEKPSTPTIQRTPRSYYTGFSSVTYGTVTQGMHIGHNAVDVANNCGSPIYSGGSGTVTRTGFDPRMAGNYVWIDHGSFKALYAHLQGIHVTAGEVVRSGEQIGTMGNTGFTRGPTGCHIHFEVRGGANPFSHMQRGQTMQ